MSPASPPRLDRTSPPGARRPAGRPRRRAPGTSTRRVPAALRSLAAAVGLLAWPGAGLAAPRLLASFGDPAGDATGPGSYLPPTDPEYQDGDFDLRRFSVSLDGDDVLLEVTLGAPFRPRLPAPRDGAAPAPQASELLRQNVDVYVDTDLRAGSGAAACIPGRRVAFADGRTWEAAVVLTPQPDLAQAATREALGPLADRVLFAAPLSVKGRTVTARVPRAFLGGEPQPGWGWSVQVSGTRRAASAATPGLVAGSGAPDALTMPVLASAGPLAFGGAPAGEAHPQVVDVLLPRGLDKARVLGSFDAASGRFAQVPFVYMDPPPPQASPSPAASAGGPAAPGRPAGGAERQPPRASPPPGPDHPAAPALTLAPNLMPRLAPGAAPGPAASAGATAAPAGAVLTVTEVTDEVVTAKGAVTGLRPMQFGRIEDAGGITVARVMILRVLDQGVLASVVSGKDKVVRGARIRFEPASP